MSEKDKLTYCYREILNKEDSPLGKHTESIHTIHILHPREWERRAFRYAGIGKH